MSKKRVYNYEAMFLLSQAVAADLNGAIEHIREIIARGHGEILAMRKWDDRRLAYEIEGQKRGYYVLVFFKAPGVDIAHVERDCNLSEKILRTMILRCDHMTEETIRAQDATKELEIEAKMRAERPAMVVQAPAPAPAPAAPEEEVAPQA
ncbi:MAG: 30S ribosomal protein S6 [Planctomycetota bacterium]|nr:30S ribosomal protein S6 [Planctomycetota bacterium]